jgi:hypothetical protein
VPSVYDKRLPLKIYPPVRPEQIYTKAAITGDVVAVYKRQGDDTYKPAAFHLIGVRD